MQATILQKIIADKMTYLAARKLKQPLILGKLRQVNAIFILLFRKAIRHLFWNVKRLHHRKALFVITLILYKLLKITNIMQQRYQC